MTRIALMAIVLSMLLLSLVSAQTIQGQGSLKGQSKVHRVPAAGIVLDGTPTTFSFVGNTSPQTFSHTCNGSNRELIVSVHMNNALTPSGVTYNSVALTQIGTTQAVGAVKMSLWGLVAPASGSNTVSVSFSGAPGYLVVVARTYTGVHQTTPLGTSGEATGTNTTATVDISSATNELVIDGTTTQGTGGRTVTVGANQTSEFNLLSTDNEIRAHGSSEPGGTTITMSWTISSSSDWGIVAVPLKPV